MINLNNNTNIANIANSNVVGKNSFGQISDYAYFIGGQQKIINFHSAINKSLKLTIIASSIVFAISYVNLAISQNQIPGRSLSTQPAIGKMPMSIEVMTEPHPMPMPRGKSRINSLEQAKKIEKEINDGFNLHVNKLERDLGISDVQQEAWQNYVNINRQNLPKAEEIFGFSQNRQNPEEINTPQNARKGVAMMRDQVDKMQKAVDAYDVLYNQCSPAQQTILRNLGIHGIQGGGVVSGMERPDKFRRERQ